MRWKEILESEETDQLSRVEAREVFRKLKEWVQSTCGYFDEVASRVSKFGGSFAFRAKSFGVHKNLIVILAPQDGGEHLGEYRARAAYGNLPTGEKVIVLHVLLRPYSTKYLDTRITGLENSFIHEYIHYLDDERSLGRANGSVAKLRSGSKSRYYNCASELNAYYHEMVHQADWYLNYLVDNRDNETIGEFAREYAAMKTPSLVREIISRFANREFWQNIVSDNRRRIEKRLARYVEHRLRPLFATLHEDGRIVKGVNTTCDVDEDEIIRQAAKFGNKVDRNGVPDAKLFEGMDSRKSELESRWNSPAFLARYEPLMNNYHCETVAEVVRRVEPGAKIVGFSDDDNPGTHHFDGDGDDGHVFAIVDDRYIVDPWMFETEGKSVWDLNDPADHQEIAKLFGERSTWVEHDDQNRFTSDKDFVS